MPDANLMIATPAYGGLVHLSYTASLLALSRAGIRHTLVGMANESLITRARNALLSAFHADASCTHLFFLDADVAISPEGVQRLVAADRDVVGAAVPLKGRGPSGQRLFNVGATLGEDGDLLVVERVGTAALLLSRRAVDALVEDAKSRGGVYARMATLIGIDNVPLHYDVFRAGAVDGEYLSEDYWACMTLRRLGFAIHVDPGIVTTHHGTMGI